MSNPKKQTSEAAVREIRRRTRRKFSPEEKIRIVLEGLRGEESVMTGLGLSLEEAYKFESKIAGQVFQTEDAKEGPKAFAEKRPPVWQSK